MTSEIIVYLSAKGAWLLEWARAHPTETALIASAPIPYTPAERARLEALLA